MEEVKQLDVYYCVGCKKIKEVGGGWYLSETPLIKLREEGKILKPRPYCFDCMKVRKIKNDKDLKKEVNGVGDN